LFDVSAEIRLCPFSFDNGLDRLAIPAIFIIGWYQFGVSNIYRVSDHLKLPVGHSVWVFWLRHICASFRASGAIKNSTWQSHVHNSFLVLFKKGLGWSGVTYNARADSQAGGFKYVLGNSFPKGHFYCFFFMLKL
jgi:hypothetical protein